MTSDRWRWLLLGKAAGVALALIVGARGCSDCIPGLDADDTAALLADLQQFEGFRPDPYRDTFGHVTVGYGTAFPLTQAEGRLLLRHRAGVAASAFEDAHSGLFPSLPHDIRVRLVDAAYQLGAGGLSTFHRALEALEAGDCRSAAVEFRASRWDVQTPERAERLARAIEDDCREDGTWR